MKENSCLLIVDVQSAMFADRDNTLANESDVLMNIQVLIDKARKADLPVVYIQHTDAEGLFLKDTPSWQIHESIAPKEPDVIVEKNSWDGFYGTSLDDVLKSLDIQTLIIAGMQTEFCLDTTIRRAYSLGYTLLVAKDGHSTFDSETLTGDQIIAHHNRIWHGRFATLLNTDDIQF